MWPGGKDLCYDRISLSQQRLEKDWVLYHDRELARGKSFLLRLLVLCRDSVLAKPRGLLSRQGNSRLRHGWPVEGRVPVATEDFRL